MSLTLYVRKNDHIHYQNILQKMRCQPGKMGLKMYGKPIYYEMITWIVPLIPIYYVPTCDYSYEG